MYEIFKGNSHYIPVLWVQQFIETYGKTKPKVENPSDLQISNACVSASGKDGNKNSTAVSTFSGSSFPLGTHKNLVWLNRKLSNSR